MHDESADRISPTELFRCAGVCADLRGAGLLDFVADDALKRKTPRIAPEGPLLGGWGNQHIYSSTSVPTLQEVNMPKTFTVNQEVKTPHGVGVVWGRILKEDGQLRIIVAHDPRKCNLPEEVLAGWRGGPSCLFHYDPEVLEAV